MIKQILLLSLVSVLVACSNNDFNPASNDGEVSSRSFITGMKALVNTAPETTEPDAGFLIMPEPETTEPEALQITN